MNRLLQVIVLLVCVVTGIFFIFKTPKNDEVIFWTLQMNDFAPYINKVISNFEKENPEVKIRWVDVPFSEGEKRTLASVLSDNPPDLINLNPDFSELLAQRGVLFEIADEYTSQYNKSIINSLKYNGKLYSLPWYATSAVTIYNKKLANGFIPKTYNDVAVIAPKIKSGAYVMLPNITENDTMLRILNKYGVTFDKISSEKSVEVFDMFKKLYLNNYIPKETVTQTHREALEKYMAEKIVYIQAGANFLTMIKENAPSVYAVTDVAPQLTGDTGQYDFSLMNFVIPIRAKHKTEALKFALYMTNEDNQLELAKLTNVLAVNQKTLNNSYYTNYSDLMSKARVISAGQLNKTEPFLKTVQNQKEINTLINTAVQKILLDEGKTADILKAINN